MAVGSAPVVGRYAPSPTGPLHLGNLRTALVCWLQVRLARGRLLLRLDDLDQPRNKPGSAEQIVEDLLWLGLDWDDEVLVQTERNQVYQEAFNQLRNDGLVFPCRCSRRDIAAARENPETGQGELSYPGTCRPENSPPPMGKDEPVAWRFHVADTRIEWHDEVLGRQCDWLSQHPGDFIIRRKDGIIAYQLASTVDDALCGVTDVVRGADLVDSTARQIALFQALGYPEPRFWHVPLMTDRDGEKLSKRSGAKSLHDLRRKGMGAGQVIGLLGSSLGLCPAGSHLSARELANRLDRQKSDFATLLRQSPD